MIEQVITLNSGALPADLEYVEERTIGASLGAASIRAGVLASLGGLGLVLLFMLAYYRLAGDTAPRPFRYRHDGDLATIGKRAAAIDFGWMKLTGWIAWWIWGFAHIYFLIGLRNRLTVTLSWLWIYTRQQRGAKPW